MLKVNVTEYAWVDGGKKLGNIPQKSSVFYMECGLSEVEEKLKQYYLANYPERFPFVDRAESIKGRII